MGIGDPGKEQFVDAIIDVRNPHIGVGLTPLMTLREEFVSSTAFKDRGGVDNVTRDFFLEKVLDCDRWRIAITYNPADDDLKRLNTNYKADKATDPDAIHSDPSPFATDNIQPQTLGIQPIPFALDGSDPNIPLNSALDLTPAARVVLSAIDRCIVAWTRLESRQRASHITIHDSLRVLGMYQNMHDYLCSFAGDQNRVDVANLRATEEPRGPLNAPNRITEQPIDTPVT